MITRPKRKPVILTPTQYYFAVKAMRAYYSLMNKRRLMRRWRKPVGSKCDYPQWAEYEAYRMCTGAKTFWLLRDAVKRYRAVLAERIDAAHNDFENLEATKVT